MIINSYFLRNAIHLKCRKAHYLKGLTILKLGHTILGLNLFKSTEDLRLCEFGVRINFKILQLRI